MEWKSLDLEIVGKQPEYALQPWRRDTLEAHISVFGWADRKGAHFREMPTRQLMSDWLMAQAEAGVILVCDKATYDVGWLLAEGLRTEVYANRWMDRQLLWKRVDGLRYEYGLQPAIAKFLPQLVGYADNMDYTDQAQLVTKNKIDTVATLVIASMHWKELAPEERKSAFIEGVSIPYVAESWVHGITHDREHLLQLRKDLTKVKLDAMYELNDELGKRGMEELTEEDIGSPQKLGKIFFEKWGMTPIKETDGGKPSTDKETLIKLAVAEPMVFKVRKVREAKNRIAKFVDGPLKSMEYNPDDRSHPEPRICGTYTGRMTYSSKQGKGKAEVPTGIALHQWARDEKVRMSFVSPEGYVMIEPDWSGQEMRLMSDYVADMTGDETMLNLFLNDIDTHSYMGASVRNVDYNWLVQHKEIDETAKQVRYLGKFANLSLQFRTGVPTLREKALTDYDMWLSEADGHHIKNTYKRTYPGIEPFWKAAIRIGGEQGYAETRGHRRVALGNMSEWGQQQTAITEPVQGTAADMKHLGLAVIGKYLLDNSMLFWFDLHDALFLLCPDNEHKYKHARTIQHMLSNLPYEKAWGWKPRLPFPVDCKIGYRWGDLKKVPKEG